MKFADLLCGYKLVKQALDRDHSRGRVMSNIHTVGKQLWGKKNQNFNDYYYDELTYKAMTCNKSPALVHLLASHPKLLSLKSIENGHALAVKLAGLVQNNM